MNGSHLAVGSTDPAPLPLLTSSTREDVLEEITRRLQMKQLTLGDAIRERELYFRVSVVANCNLSCQFCHNEGAPEEGRILLSVAERAVESAARAGFTRVQFTGGEPLLRKDIGDFVAMAHKYVDDVGITTNGTFLPNRIDSLIAARVTRIHVSLQEESLAEAGSDGHWGIPEWLAPTVQQASEGKFILRLNLPVPANCLDLAEDFLRLLVCDVKVFSVLPEGNSKAGEYPLAALEDMVTRINAERRASGVDGEVLLRGFRPPSGIRCPECADRARCKEQSHSLRLGADYMLRPCLATRSWDSRLLLDDVDRNIVEAAMLALDYQW